MISILATIFTFLVY